MSVYVRKIAVFLTVAVVLTALVLLSGCGELLTGDSEGRKNWAIIIGISDYQATSLNLRWADEDALDLYDALRRGKNWEADKITVLTNGAATKDAIKAAIIGLAKRVSADDQVVFYFSGRGTYGPDQPPFDEGDGLDEYLMPYDSLTTTSGHDLNDDELEALFSALPTNNIMIILDTSFVRATTPGNAAGKDKSFLRAGEARGLPRGIDGMNHDLGRPGYILFTASQPGEAASESNQLRNSVFTYYLVDGLRGAANPGKKIVTAQQAFEYAGARTRAFANGQIPQFVDHRGKLFRLASFK